MGTPREPRGTVRKNYRLAPLSSNHGFHSASTENSAETVMNCLASLASRKSSPSVNLNEKIDTHQSSAGPRETKESGDHGPIMPAELNAAAILSLMSYHNRTHGLSSQADSEVGNRVQRWRRLSQNQQYRKRLLEKGVFPVRQGSHKFACSLCSETYDKEMFVWRHGVKHLEQKPFKCSICQGLFNRSDSLQRHIRNFHQSLSD